MRSGFLHTTAQRLHGLQQYTGASVFIETIPASTETLEGAGVILTHVITSSASSQTIIYIVTAASISVQTISGCTVTLITSRIVCAVVLTTRAAVCTLVYIDAGLVVVVQMISSVTAAHGSSG